LSFFRELKRRNIFRVGITYLALAWLLTEVADTLFPGFGIPDWAFRFVVIVLILGFVPVMIFTWAYEITPEGLKREQDVVRDAATNNLTARRLDKLTIGIVLAALVFIAADRLWLGSQPAGQPQVTHEAPSQTAQVAEPIEQVPATSIAVLPFANRSDNPKDVFFVDGIHDDLLTFISQIGSIKTISRTSVMKYRDSTMSIPEIARELTVATVLEGGVQRAGDQVRINVQLIDAHTDDHLWSQIYDRQLTATNIFSIQSEIAGSIAEALRAELTPEAQERITSVPTENLEALEAYFLGRQSMTTRRVADLAEAVGHFERAVTLDPKFALAHANLSIAYALYRNYAGLPREEWYAKGQASAERALQLSPGLAEAHTSEGVIKWYRRDHKGAEAAFRQAIQLNPNDAQANQWLGVMLGVSMGRVEEGLMYSRKAVMLDPKSAIILADYGDVLANAGRHDEALIQYQQAVAIEPRFSKGYRLTGDLLAYLGKLGQAISAYHKAREIEPDTWQLSLRMGSLYLNLGDDRQAETWLNLAREQAPQGKVQIGTELGRLYLYRGDSDRAREHFSYKFESNPDDPLTLYHLANLDLAEDDVSGAIARYQKAHPHWLENVTNFASEYHVNAIHFAAILSIAGQEERMRPLLDAATLEVASFDPRHHSDEAAIHALRGDSTTALEVLSNMTNGERIQIWKDFVLGHPAFQELLGNPKFRALDEKSRAEMARQLEELRALEISSELSSPLSQ
jgi:TolB-like protein/Tfp pilus assembly protein PilF